MIKKYYILIIFIFATFFVVGYSFLNLPEPKLGDYTITSVVNTPSNQIANLTRANHWSLLQTFNGGASATYILATSTTASTFVGSVGIGTTSPYSKLSVWGSGTGTNKLFELTNSASTTLASFLENGTGYFLGNIGIGTTSPYAKLSVVGQAVSEYFTATSTTATSTISGGLNVVGVLGIGTTTPQGKFHVSAGASATTTVNFAELGLTSSKSCINLNQIDGASSSIYIAGGVLVVENNYCK